MNIQFHGDAANPKLKVLHSEVQERVNIMENEDTVVIPLKLLKEWRELIHFKPQDLAARIDGIIDSFTPKPEPKRTTIPGQHTWHEKSRG